MAIKTETYRTKAYLEQSIRDIDSIFGEGYSKNNPELLSTYMKCSIDSEFEETIENSLRLFEEPISSMDRSIYSISKSLEKLIDK